MAERNEHLVQSLENGNIFISEEVIASVAALAVREVEGVYGLGTASSVDLGSIVGKKNLRKGIRVLIEEENIDISCNLIVKIGTAVVDVAKRVQDSISSEVSAMVGIQPRRVNVNVCAVASPKAQ